jgi:hypothetical protein
VRIPPAERHAPRPGTGFDGILTQLRTRNGAGLDNEETLVCSSFNKATSTVLNYDIDSNTLVSAPVASSPDKLPAADSAPERITRNHGVVYELQELPIEDDQAVTCIEPAIAGAGSRIGRYFPFAVSGELETGRL